MALMEACLTVLRGREQRPGAEPIYRPAIPDIYRVPEALLRMRALVAELTEPRPLTNFYPALRVARRDEPDVVKSAVASTFIAALELCRELVVGLGQGNGFGTILVSPSTTGRPAEPTVRG